MTVSYTSEVVDCKGFGCFWKLLFKWKGSIYKLVWPDLLAYTFLYFIFSAVYRYALDENGRRTFENVSLHTQYFTDFIPLSFVLGFYVSIVVKRWWDQYETLPWPDTLALYISTSVIGNDDRARMMRRTILRYANLSFVMALRMISPKVKKRFPTFDHFIEAGILTENEKKIFEGLSSKTTHPTYWMPFVWAGTLVARARKEGRIRDDFTVKTIIDEITHLRGLCGKLLGYDWISIPLVYTQVVTLSVYAFFLATLMGRQFLDPKMKYDKHNIDFVFPIFTYLQFFFYMGWLKVAESLVNPFGEDDDDFEINYLIDRNLQVSYLIVDEMHNEHPELIQDIYWDEIFPSELPYTKASQEFKTETYLGSTANISITEVDQEILPIVEEETNEELLNVESENPSASHTNPMKRIGSNLSTFFHQPPKLAVNTILARKKKRLPRVSSKSSDFNIKTDHEYPYHDASISGSDNYLHSSRDSVDVNRFAQDRNKVLLPKDQVRDEGFLINISKGKKDDFSESEDTDDLGEYDETPFGTPPHGPTLPFKKKERLVSEGPANFHREHEGLKESGMNNNSPPKLMEFFKPNHI